MTLLSGTCAENHSCFRVFRKSVWKKSTFPKLTNLDMVDMLFHKRLIARQFEPKTVLVSHSGSNYKEKLLILMFSQTS